ncbi:MAG TPA: helix-turn-helix transcriptional regulator [Candidatus Solibacter sp.]|jgi:DNA-binding CsgD family transcriptional regulator|nr:helix-turn-helix transcriptional regulator [Candidatus Solibacter sp.]
MDQLLVLPMEHGISEQLLGSLRQAGWRITVTVDIVRAKQLLQKGDIAALVLESNPSRHDVDRMKILRFVQEFCPSTLVILLYGGTNMVVSPAERHLVEALNSAGDPTKLEARPAHDLYQLSPAQKRIAELVAQAYPNKEIARILKIKEQSVRNELSRIFKKMGVWNRVELALLMRKDQESHLAAGGEDSGHHWEGGTKPPTGPPVLRASAAI